MLRSFFVASLFLSALLLFSGCAQKSASDDDVITVPEAAQTVNEQVKAPEAPAAVVDDKGPETIFFEFNSYALTPASKQLLKSNVNWFKENPQLTVIIEGYADERGSNQYNMALGERRALSTQKYLTDLGVSPDRLDVISYGEERPASEGHDAAAWQQNRRVEFNANRY